MPPEYTGSRLKHVSYSELSTWRQCPHKHQLAYVERWQPPVEGAALTRGRVFHEMLAAHYRALRDGVPLAARKEIDDILGRVADEQAADLLRWMYEGYVECWGNEEWEQWTVLEVEDQREVPLPTETGGHSVYALKMVADLLVRDGKDRIWLVDHKTNADFPREVGLDLEDQFSLYAWGYQQLGVPVHGVVYNCIRTRRNKKPMSGEERFRRLPMYRTRSQLENTALDAWRTTRRMRSARWTERATNSDTCQWRCPYTEPCLWGRKGGNEREFLVSAGFTQNLQ